MSFCSHKKEQLNIYKILKRVMTSNVQSSDSALFVIVSALFSFKQRVYCTRPSRWKAQATWWNTTAGGTVKWALKWMFRSPRKSSGSAANRRRAGQKIHGSFKLPKAEPVILCHFRLHVSRPATDYGLTEDHVEQKLRKAPFPLQSGVLGCQQ